MVAVFQRPHAWFDVGRQRSDLPHLPLLVQLDLQVQSTLDTRAVEVAVHARYTEALQSQVFLQHVELSQLLLLLFELETTVNNPGFWKLKHPALDPTFPKDRLVLASNWRIPDG